MSHDANPVQSAAVLDGVALADIIIGLRIASVTLRPVLASVEYKPGTDERNHDGIEFAAEKSARLRELSDKMLLLLDDKQRAMVLETAEAFDCFADGVFAMTPESYCLPAALAMYYGSLLPSRLRAKDIEVKQPDLTKTRLNTRHLVERVLASVPGNGHWREYFDDQDRKYAEELSREQP